MTRKDLIMSDKTVSQRAVAAFLASVALAIREAEAQTHPEPQFVRTRLNQHLDGMVNEMSPLSERERNEVETLRQGLTKYLNQALNQ